MANYSSTQRCNSLTRRLAHAEKNGTKTDVKLITAALNKAKKQRDAELAKAS
jgi:hypothetical protein